MQYILKWGGAPSLAISSTEHSKHLVDRKIILLVESIVNRVGDMNRGSGRFNTWGVPACRWRGRSARWRPARRWRVRRPPPPRGSGTRQGRPQACPRRSHTGPASRFPSLRSPARARARSHQPRASSASRSEAASLAHRCPSSAATVVLPARKGEAWSGRWEWSGSAGVRRVAAAATTTLLGGRSSWSSAIAASCSTQYDPRVREPLTHWIHKNMSVIWTVINCETWVFSYKLTPFY